MAAPYSTFAPKMAPLRYTGQNKLNLKSFSHGVMVPYPTCMTSTYTGDF
jgi:hypothetical protein